jgi:hypothetical protein
LAKPGYANQQDLLRWADSHEARGEFPRLIRRLILETTPGLTDLTFAAAEGTSVGGWDGVARTTVGTLFVPLGLSGWELSVDKNTTRKIDGDYEKRTESPDGSPTQECTYVQVLLRRWSKRKDWALQRSKEKRWTSVQSLGIDDIEMWLEEAPISHAWISERLELGPHGLRTVETWWANWSSATNPALPPELLLAGRENESQLLRNRQASMPQLTTIGASSRDEALAFLGAFVTLEDTAGQGAMMARTAIVDEVTTWRSLRLRTHPLILVANSDAVAAESGGASVHHIIVPVVGAASADIDLSPIDSGIASGFLKTALGETRAQDAEDLARLARISLLAARRRIATKPELLQPAWAGRPVQRMTRRLLLGNRWTGEDGDKAVISKLGGEPYGDIAEEIAKLNAGEDPFLTRVGHTVSVVSAYDAWILLKAELQTGDIERFREAVLEVLGAINPALDLPTDQRWQAAIRGKSKPHSHDLRVGVATSLALLGALGDRAIVGGTGTGAEWAGRIVWELLKQANDDPSGSAWASLDDVLPLLAEAAPAEFLAAVAKGLEGDPPLLRSIFGADDGGFFSHPTHSGLLWGLELSAWSSEYFGQATDLLAHLSEVDPGGRYSNRPINSLGTIFCPWYPQNAVDNTRRLDVIDALRRRHPAIAWTLMVSCLPQLMATSQPTYAPRYRQWKPPDAPVSVREYWDFIDGLIDRLMSDAGEDAMRWRELIDKLDDVPPDLRQRWLDRLRLMSGQASLTEVDRGWIWDVLRGLVARHREFEDAKWRLPEPQIDAIAEVADLFKPASPRIRHAWLFAEHAPSLDGVRRTNNHQDYEQALQKLRAEAIVEIAAGTSWDEIVQFARASKVPFTVGQAMVNADLSAFDDELSDLINSDDPAELEFARAYCIDRSAKHPGWLDAKLSDASLVPRHHARLLLCLTDHGKAWAAADAAGADVATEYWRAFSFLPRPDPIELATAATRMTDVGRAGAALDLLSLWLPDGDDHGITTAIEHALGQFLVQDQAAQRVPSEYDFERLFSYLDRSTSVPVARIGLLEWAYLTALEHTKRKLKLFDAMADAPDVFVDLVTRIYRPREPEEQEEDEQPTPVPDEGAARIAQNAWRLLNRWNVIPGTREDGDIDPAALRSWVTAAREQLKALNRAEVGDIHIGNILAASPIDPDGHWPIRAIRDLLEDLGSSDLERGFRTAIVNRRGVTSRGLEDGGGQERDLALDFRNQADRLGDRSPRTAAILRAIADSYEGDSRRNEADAERFRIGLEGSGGGPLRTAAHSGEDEVLYFAYGSNMSTARTEERVGKVRARGTARLAGHKIAFDKAGADGTGKTNIVPNKATDVWGVLFGISAEQFKKLAGYEVGYVEQSLSVRLGNEDVLARTFVADKRTRGLRPSREYLGFLIAGANEHRLPDGYAKALKAIKVANEDDKGGPPLAS